MEKGISYFFGYEIKKKEKIRLIKEAGFTSVITSADKKFEKSKWQNFTASKVNEKVRT